MLEKKIVLTGDRPTGSLHLGHYVGSLKNRVSLQDECLQFLMIADMQGLTDYWENPSIISENVREVLLDYLACGIDPLKTTIFLQSQIPELAELSMIFMNFVGIGRLMRNPTLKTEIRQKNFSENLFDLSQDKCSESEMQNQSQSQIQKKSLNMGFFSYPISQASDISLFMADLVPVGDDQLPMIEQTNEITAKFNQVYNVNFFKKTKALTTPSGGGRLSGIDGKAKMSKSLGNAIFLKDSNDEIAKKVKMCYTDPQHIKVSDPGKIEGNVVFEYLDAFYEDREDLEELKDHYRRGGLGDSFLKAKLTEILIALIEPIRQKRIELMKNSNDEYLKNVLQNGCLRASEFATKNFQEIRKIMKLDYKDFFC